jgi:hypothetical protein
MNKHSEKLSYRIRPLMLRDLRNLNRWKHLNIPNKAKDRNETEVVRKSVADAHRLPYQY